MKINKKNLYKLIAEAYNDLVEPGAFGDWLKRLGALKDHPEFDQETWNKIGDMLTSDDESNRTQGREILDSYGFDDWGWLDDVMISWDQAAGAKHFRTQNFDPGEPMYRATYDIGDYGDGISRLVNQDQSAGYLEDLKAKMQPLTKRYDLYISNVEGRGGSFSDPSVVVMLDSPTIGWQIHHFGGASGLPRVFPIGKENEITSAEFISWFMDNFKETELSGDIDRDTKLLTKLVKSIAKFRTLDSHLKQSLFLKKPEMASKILNAKAAIGLEE